MAVYMALYVLESFWSFTWGSVNLDRKRQDEAEAKDKKIEELTRSRVPELRGEVMQGIIDYASNSPLGTVKLDESQVKCFSDATLLTLPNLRQPFTITELRSSRAKESFTENLWL